MMIKTEEISTVTEEKEDVRLISPNFAERVFQFDRSVITTGVMANLPHAAWAVYVVLGVCARYRNKERKGLRTCFPSYETITLLSGIDNPARPCKALKTRGLIDMKWRPRTSNLYTILDQDYSDGSFFEFNAALLFDGNVTYTWASLPNAAKAVYLVLRAKVHNNSFRLFTSPDFKPYFNKFLDDWWANEDRREIDEYFDDLHEEIAINDSHILTGYHEGIFRPYIALTEALKKTYAELAGISDLRTFGKALADLERADIVKIFRDDVYCDEYIWPLPNTYFWP
jgi:hypothetical protein